MAVYNKFDSFVEAVCEKVHNLQSDQLMVALSNVAPSSSNTKLADITEIAYTNLSSRVLVTSSSAQSGGLYKLILNDLVLTASGTVATFRYVIIYNNTATNKELIAYFDNGSPVTMGNADTYTLDFDNANGILQLQ